MPRRLRLRPMYGRDEETGPETFVRGIDELIAERQEREAERRAFENQVAMSGGQIVERPGRRSVGDIWRQRPRVLGGQGGLSRGPAPIRTPVADAGVPGDYAEVEGPDRIRARVPTAQQAARMKHQQALEALREEYRLRGELPRSARSGRTIEEEKELITHRAQESARTRRPLVGRGGGGGGRVADDPDRRREAWIGQRTAELMRQRDPDTGERISPNEAAEIAADAWEAMQGTRNRPRRGVGVSVGPMQLDTPEARAGLGRRPAPRDPGGNIELPRSSGTRPAPPPVGTVRNGYRFRGGDPANRANWERVAR